MENDKPAHVLGLAKLAGALAKAQLEYTALKKSKTAKIRMKAGGEYSYKYADLSDLIDATRPALGKHGLAVAQMLNGDQLLTVLMHESGDRIESTFRVPINLSPQEFGSALTYYRRYTMGAILGIAGEEDDDGKGAQEAASGNTSSDEKPKREAAKSPPPKPDPELPAVINKHQMIRLWAIAGECQWSDEDVHVALKKTIGVDSVKELPLQAYEGFCNYMKRYTKVAK